MHMKRTSWILGSMAAFLLAACGGGSAGGDADMGGAETGSPGMAADTVPAGGAMDTALTDTTTMTTDTATN